MAYDMMATSTVADEISLVWIFINLNKAPLNLESIIELITVYKTVIARSFRYRLSNLYMMIIATDTLLKSIHKYNVELGSSLEKNKEDVNLVNAIDTSFSRVKAIINTLNKAALMSADPTMFESVAGTSTVALQMGAFNFDKKAIENTYNVF